jgi:hypothetical protein
LTAKFVQAKDLDDLKAWKSTVSGKLDDLIKENQEMRQVPFPRGAARRLIRSPVFGTD